MPDDMSKNQLAKNLVNTRIVDVGHLRYGKRSSFSIVLDTDKVLAMIPYNHDEGASLHLCLVDLVEPDDFKSSQAEPQKATLWDKLKTVWAILRLPIG